MFGPPWGSYFPTDLSCTAAGLGMGHSQGHGTKIKCQRLEPGLVLGHKGCHFPKWLIFQSESNRGRGAVQGQSRQVRRPTLVGRRAWCHFCSRSFCHFAQKMQTPGPRSPEALEEKNHEGVWFYYSVWWTVPTRSNLPFNLDSCRREERLCVILKLV